MILGYPLSGQYSESIHPTDTIGCILIVCMAISVIILFYLLIKKRKSI